MKMNKVFSSWRKKIKIEFLIFYNGFVSLRKFKFPLIVFLILTTLLSTTISTFTEINSQLKNEIRTSQINSKSNDHKYIYSTNENYFPENVYDIFCTDYHEISVQESDSNNLLVKRVPRLSFGREGCFQSLNIDDLQINYVVNPVTKQILKIRTDSSNYFQNSIYIENNFNAGGEQGIVLKSEKLKFNEDNPHHQNSLYWRLKQKYIETNNLKYKNLADELYDLFFDRLRIFIENSLAKYLNQFLQENKIYEKSFLQNDILSNFIPVNYQKTGKQPSDLKGLTSLKKFLLVPDNKILKTNRQKIFAHWRTVLAKIMDWEEKKLIIPSSPNDKNFQTFEQRINDLIKNYSNDFTKLNTQFLHLMESYSTSNKFPAVWNWIKTELKTLQTNFKSTSDSNDFWNQELSPKIKLIFLNTLLLENKIEMFFTTLLSEFYDLIQTWENVFDDWKVARKQWMIRKNQLSKTGKPTFIKEEIFINKNLLITAKEIKDKFAIPGKRDTFFTSDLFHKIKKRINLLRNQIQLWNFDQINTIKTFNNLIAEFQKLFPKYSFVYIKNFSQELHPDTLNREITESWIKKINEKIDKINWFKNIVIEQNERFLAWQKKYQELYNFEDVNTRKVYLKFAKLQPFINNNKFEINLFPREFLLDSNEIDFIGHEKTPDISEKVNFNEAQVYSFRELWALWSKTQLDINSVSSFKLNKELLKISLSTMNLLYSESQKQSNLNFPNVTPDSRNLFFTKITSWINFFDSQQIKNNIIWKNYWNVYRAIRAAELLDFSIDTNIIWNDENDKTVQKRFEEIKNEVIKQLKQLFSAFANSEIFPEKLTNSQQLSILTEKEKYIYFLIAQEKNLLAQSEHKEYEKLVYEKNNSQLRKKKLSQQFLATQTDIPIRNNYKNVFEQEVILSHARNYENNWTKTDNLLNKFQKKLNQLKLKGFNSDFYQFFYPVRNASFWFANIIKPLINDEYKFSNEFFIKESLIKQIYAKWEAGSQNNQIKFLVNFGMKNFISSKNHHFLARWNLEKIYKILNFKIKNFIQKHLPNLSRKNIHINLKKLSRNIANIRANILWTPLNQIQIIKDETSSAFDWNKHQELVTKIRAEEKRLFIKNALNLSNWQTDTNPYFMKQRKQNVGIVNPKELETFHKANAYLNNFNLRVLKNTYFKDKNNEKEGLIVEYNSDFNFKLTKDSSYPKQIREVILSTNYAKKKNIKIGDEIPILGIRGFFKVVGLGAQSEFIFPGISILNPIPKGDEFIVYVSPFFYNLIKEQIHTSLSSIFSFQKNDYFLYFEGDKAELKNSLDQFKIDIGEKFKGYTEKSLQNYPKKLSTKEQNFNFKPVNNRASKLKIFESAKFFSPNYFLNRTVVNLVSTFFWISSFVLILIILLGWIISLLNLMTRKIEESKKSLGILRAQGISNFQIIFDSVGLIGPMFIGLFLGWILATFLEIPIFIILEQKFTFNFHKYFFNFLNLAISFGIIFFTFFLVTGTFYRFKIQNVKILDLIGGARRNMSNRLIFYLKAFTIRKFKILRGTALKINYLFFLSIWKKIFVLFLVICFFVLNLVGTILLYGVAEETIEKQYENTNYEWVLKYKKPVVGNPFTRVTAYKNNGYKSVIADDASRFEPLNNRRGKIYVQIGNPANPEQLRHKFYPARSLKNLDFITSPLHNRSLNFVYLKNAFKDIFQSVDSEKIDKTMCETMSTLFRRDFGKDCLDFFMNKLIPFEYSDSNQDPVKLRKIRMHFPASGNSVQYNDKNDEFFTEFTATRSESGLEISVLGIVPNSKAFVLSKKQLQLLHTSSDNSDQVNVIVNRVFLDNFPDLKVGSEFTLQNEQKKFYIKPFKTPIREEDWSYLVPGTNQIKSFRELPRDMNFYKGSKIKNLNNNLEIDKNAQIWLVNADGSKTQAKLTYLSPFVNQSKEKVYLDLIDIERVQLRLPNGEKVLPFKADAKYGLNFIDEPSTWWTDQLGKKNFEYKKSWTPVQKNRQNLKFKIVGTVGTYHNIQILISQKAANKILNYPETNNEEFANLPEKHLLRQENYFTGRFSYAKPVEEVIYNISINHKFGYIDLETVESGGRSLTIKNFQSIHLEKAAAKELLNYVLSLMTLTFIISFIGAILLLIFVLRNILEIIKNKSVPLKILGFSAKELFKQSVLLVLIPSFIATLAGIGFVHLAVISLQQYFVLNYQFYFFVNNSFLVYLSPVLILIGLFIVFSWLQYYSLQRLKLAENIKNNV